jgi:CheY-like chemotaxis protein
MSDAFLPGRDDQSTNNLSNIADPSSFTFADSVGEGTARTCQDRRRRRRALISAPVRVRAVDVTHGGPDEISTTIDVSRTGVLFTASQPAYDRGMNVMVTFPYTKSPTAIHAEQPGRIARIFQMPDGRFAVAIAFAATGDGVDLVDAGGRKLNQAPVASDTTEVETPKKPLVLALESNPSVRESLKDFLTAEGYDVIAVNNTSDARDVLNLFTPVLVIAEIEGEGLPGYAICAHVKGTSRLQRIPVLLTTSSAYPSDYSSAHSLGAVVCMAKPYKQDRLGHIVRLLAPLPHAKIPTAPPHPVDPSRKPGANQRRATARGGCADAHSGSIFWRFRSAK